MSLFDGVCYVLPVRYVTRSQPHPWNILQLQPREQPGYQQLFPVLFSAGVIYTCLIDLACRNDDTKKGLARSNNDSKKLKSLASVLQNVQEISADMKEPAARGRRQVGIDELINLCSLSHLLPNCGQLREFPC